MHNVELRALNLEDMEPIREWRNRCLDTLRTSFPLTKEQQIKWYETEICDRKSNSRFFAVDIIIIEHSPIDTYKQKMMIGYGGIENIQWENSIGEISLLINPDEHRNGYGISAAKKLISVAFDKLGLMTVYAECYNNNPAIDFWKKVFDGFYSTRLPSKKYSNGVYYDSTYFSMSNI